MPIYRVPELSSKPKFNNDHPPQDSRRHHHHRRRQQQQHNQHQSHFDHLQQQQRSDEIAVQKSHSTPKPVSETRRRSSSPALLPLLMPPVQGDESIVEREIRLQLEREAEIAKLHRALETNASDELETTDRPTTKGGTYGAEEEAASPDVGSRRRRRRHSSVTYDDRHAVSEYSRVQGQSLIARELVEQKRREDELRNRRRDSVAKVKDGDEGTGRNSSAGKPDSGHAVSARKTSFQEPLSFEDPEEEEEEPDLSRTSVEGPPRRTRGDRLPPPSGERRLRATEAPRDRRRRSSGLEAEENLRRLAADRLRQELLSERQREIDLQQQGKISTTSEERVGLDPSLLTKGKTARGAASSSSSSTPPDAAHRSVGDGLSHRIQVDAAELSGGGGGGGSVNRPSTPSRSTGRQSEAMRKSVELRIEEEVREARKREKELREQRRLLNAALLTSP